MHNMYIKYFSPAIYVNESGFGFEVQGSSGMHCMINQLGSLNRSDRRQFFIYSNWRRPRKKTNILILILAQQRRIHSTVVTLAVSMHLQCAACRLQNVYILELTKTKQPYAFTRQLVIIYRIILSHTFSICVSVCVCMCYTLCIVCFTTHQQTNIRVYSYKHTEFSHLPLSHRHHSSRSPLLFSTYILPTVCLNAAQYDEPDGEKVSKISRERGNKYNDRMIIYKKAPN